MPAQQLFVRALNKKFPSLKIIILTIQFPYMAESYLWCGNRVRAFNGKKYGRVLRPILWWKVYRSIRKVHTQESVVGILSFWCSESALVGKLFSQKWKISHLIWILGQDARKQNKFARWIKPQPNELVALSDFLAEEFYRSHLIRPSHVVYNGIEPTLFPEPYETRDIDVLGAGSLNKLKQFHIFVEVISKLKEAFPHVKAVLAGKGPEENKLRSLIEQLNLQSNITFTGELPHKEVLALMMRSKILLHPSMYEGYSTVCLEALYAGCHVISFTSAENSGIKHWRVVPNVETMTERCREVLMNEADFSPINTHMISQSAEAIMKLFHYQVT
jgi:glycosyltransferase involved in cell wall biosynthesis